MGGLLSGAAVVGLRRDSTVVGLLLGLLVGSTVVGLLVHTPRARNGSGRSADVGGLLCIRVTEGLLLGLLVG